LTGGINEKQKLEPCIMAKSSEKDSKLDLYSPQEMSLEEFNNLKAEVAELSESEAEGEWLESCRYGEVDILRALLSRFPKLVSSVDHDSGNSGLHMASANGHLRVVKFLVYHQHRFTKNGSGNTPLHWAASNGQAEVVNFFTTNAELHDVDVLEKNQFGRSALTEGFSSEKEGVVEALLEHDSATEEKLLSVNGNSKSHVVHKLFNKEKPLLVRELAMVNADNPFADADRPDQDTTGLSIWSASLVLARWLNTKSWDNASVVELGAGCGVPGLAVAACQPSPRQVYVTDLNPQTVDNLDHNIKLNEFKDVQALRMDWCDRSTWPKEKLDYVVGSDLIYQKSLVPLLSGVVMELMNPGGTFFYVAPDTGRDGLEEFIKHMKKRCPQWTQQEAPAEYHDNPLTNGDDEECFLHFQELSSLKYILYEFPIPES
jgi:predicted nicotinamide N-methyase